MGRRLALGVLVAMLSSTACTGRTEPPGGATEPATNALPIGAEPVTLDPANFVEEIDHPYWPTPRGASWGYTEGDQRVQVTAMGQTREIEGITATVVRDVVTDAEGAVVEDTLDWYAQDSAGNIWYLGEDTKEYENGEVVSTEGSWEHGVDGAFAGILLPADPVVGLEYRQEHYAGKAEDRGKILSLEESVEVPFGSFEGCWQTEDTTPLEPEVLEHKYYCKGIGLTLAVLVSDGGAREELVETIGLDPGSGYGD